MSEVVVTGDLQAAVDRALGGDVLVLDAGATYTGGLTLKPGKAGVTVRTAAELPERRVHPSDGPRLARVLGGVQTAPGAQGYTLVGLEVAPTPDGGTVVALGAPRQALGDVPSGLTLDRCYVHGEPNVEQVRGIALNSRTTIIQRCYVSDIKAMGRDSQAIAGWAGPGGYVIEDCYLEAAGENILFGGGSMPLEGVTPNGIVIRRNTLTKPLTWRGSSWVVKNLLELKHARNVTITGNLLEACWQAGQDGHAVLFTPRNQDGDNPWAAVEDVAFGGNIVRHVAAGVNVLGTDDLHPSGKAARILISNNLFDDLNAGIWGGSGRFLTVTGGEDLEVVGNTVYQTGPAVWFYGAPTTRFGFVRNVAWGVPVSISGDGCGWDMRLALDQYAPFSSVAGNCWVGRDVPTWGAVPPGCGADLKALMVAMTGEPAAGPSAVDEAVEALCGAVRRLAEVLR